MSIQEITDLHLYSGWSASELAVICDWNEDEITKILSQTVTDESAADAVRQLEATTLVASIFSGHGLVTA